MVICLNEAARISDCLASLSFCDEVVVLDSGSTDGTVDLVRSAGATLIQRPFSSWNDQKEAGRLASSGEWVLNLDADEVVSPELRQEILDHLSQGIPEEIGGFSMPFRNRLRGEWIKSCGFYPDRHVRLVRRERARWDASAVHDRLVVEGKIAELEGHVDHYSFESIADYLEKSNIYAEAFARDAIARGARSSTWKIFIHTFGRFVRSYFLRGGFLEGALGLTMAGLQAAGVFQKYVRLWEMQRFPEARPEALAAELGDPWREQRIGKR